MDTNQKGFSLLYVLLVLVIIGIVAGTGWFVYKANKSVDDTLNAANNSSAPTRQKSEDSNPPKPEVKWLTYKNDEAKLTFDYPETWKSEVNKTEYYDTGMFGVVSGALTSPKGKKLEWIYSVMGGKGGWCDPEPGDVAFQPGNKCSSKQILSAEKTRDVKAPEGVSFRNLFNDALFITHTKHTSMWDDAGKISYQICLDAYYTSKTQFHEDETPKPSTIMGLVFPCAFWSTGFNAKFNVDSEADFDSEDALMAEKIMKTFNSL